MTQARISVLLPSLAYVKTLSLAITSTLFALGPADELLVLIEGSDRKNEEVEKIKDKRLKVFYQQQKLGISSGLNFLLSQSKGRFIARMDSDDICLPGRFRAQLRKLTRHNLDFVFSNAILFGKGVRPFGFIPQLPYGLDNKQIGLELALRNPLVHPTMLARKEALVSLSGYRLSIAEDYDLWNRAWSQGYSIGRLWGYGLLYRVHPQQYSRRTNHALEVRLDALLAASSLDLKAKLVDQGLILDGEEFEADVRFALQSTSAIYKVLALGVTMKLVAFAKYLIRVR